MYRPEPPKDSRRASVLFVGALASFLGFIAQQAMWFAYRPRAPDPATGNVIRVFDKGVIYVSQQDLGLCHALLVLSVVLVTTRSWVSTAPMSA